MIRYTLNCDNGHSFESWFANSSAYDKQAKRSLIACPICNSTKVDKAIMAPRLGRGEAADEARFAPQPVPAPAPAPPPAPPSPVAMMSPGEHELRNKLKELREHIVKNADYVGPRFPEQARKIHYGEPSIARSTARRRPKRPRNCTRKASPSRRCRSCRTSSIERLVFLPACTGRWRATL